MSQGASLIRFQRGGVVNTQGGGVPHVFVVKKGVLKLRFLNYEGKEVIIDVVGAGDLFGDVGPAVDGDAGVLPREVSQEAVALEPGEALAFTVPAFRELLRRQPQALPQVCQRVDQVRRRLENRMVRLLFKSSVGKVAGVLLELSDRFGRPQGDGIYMRLKLTHRELGALTGVKRETVSLAMAQLECDELIQVLPDGFLVLEALKLSRVP